MSRLPSLVLIGILVALGGTVARPPLASAGPTLTRSTHPVLVQGLPTTLTVSAYRWPDTGAASGPVLFKRGTTRSAVLVARIVRVLNQVNPITPGSVHSCPGRADRNVLQFGYSNGDRWTVYDDGCWDFFTHGERGTALGDPPVYTVIYRLIDLVAGVPVGRFNLAQVKSHTMAHRRPAVSVTKGPIRFSPTTTRVS